MAQNSVFINIPVADLSRSIKFYSALGFVQNAAFSNDVAAMMSLPPAPSSAPAVAHDGPIKIMLLTHPFFQGFLPQGVTIPDATKTAQVIVCFGKDSKEAVDEFVDKVAKNGGRKDIRAKTDIEKQMEEGGAYGAAVADPDGHILEVMYMPEQPKAEK